MLKIDFILHEASVKHVRNQKPNQQHLTFFAQKVSLFAKSVRFGFPPNFVDDAKNLTPDRF